MTVSVTKLELQTWTLPPDPLAWAFEAASKLPQNDDEARVALGILAELVGRYRFVDEPLERRDREAEAGGNKTALRVVVNPLGSPK